MPLGTFNRSSEESRIPTECFTEGVLKTSPSASRAAGLVSETDSIGVLNILLNIDVLLDKCLHLLSIHWLKVVVIERGAEHVKLIRYRREQRSRTPLTHAIS